MTSQVIYQGNLRTQARHLKSGNEIITDAPTDNHGKGEAFSPTDLVATALATCMLTVMGIKARDQGWDLEGSKANITKIMASHPRRISEIHIVLEMGGDSLSVENQSLLEQIALNCPVAKSVSSEIQQQISFKWQARKEAK
jgi:uncharacterized OsmC-like protein